MALADCLPNEEEISHAETQCILNVTMLFIHASPQTDYNAVTYPRKFTSVAMSSSKKPLCNTSWLHRFSLPALVSLPLLKAMDSHFKNRHYIFFYLLIRHHPPQKKKKTWEIVYYSITGWPSQSIVCTIISWLFHKSVYFTGCVLQKETASKAAQGSDVAFRLRTTTGEEKKSESKDLMLGN